MSTENGASSSTSNKPEVDLVGGPFSVVESDPGMLHLWQGLTLNNL